MVFQVSKNKNNKKEKKKRKKGMGKNNMGEERVGSCYYIICPIFSFKTSIKLPMGHLAPYQNTLRRP